MCSTHILATLGLGENKAWKYNPSDRILIVDLHKLHVPIGYDNEKQMSKDSRIFTLGWLTMLSFMRMWSLAHEMPTMDVPWHYVTL
jgi:hypothetical protein